MLPLRAYLTLLATNLVGLGRRVTGLVVALAVGTALQLVNPQLLRRIIDGALGGSEDDRLVRLAAVFVAVALTAQLVTVLATWLAEEIGWRATNRLRAELTAHVLGLDLGFHTDHSPGHLIERVDGDVTALSNFFSAMTVKVLGNAALLVGVLVLLARESWLVGVLVTALVALAMVGFVRLQALAVPWWTEVSAVQAEVYGQVGELVDGTEDVVPNGASAFVQERFAQRLRAWLPAQVRGWTGFGLMWGSSQLLMSATTIVVFVVGTRLFDVGELTVGTVFLLTYYTGMIERPLHQLRDQFTDLQKAGGAIVRIRQLQAVRPTLVADGTTTLPRGPLGLRLDGVSFAYPADEVDDGDDGDGDGGDPDEDHGPRVLHGVDLELAPGRVLGVVGRTGSGKSTLAKLVVRLHDPQAGTVSLGGVALPEVADLRDRVGMVTQDVQLFRASVRDNLTFFDDRVDDDRLLAVLDELALTSWLSGLPDGLDTVLDGDDLSAGQAQLLAFARIFLRDPGLVVLDEASSRLDPATEALLERAVDRLLEHRTAIVIAHRLHTLHRVDDVLVLEQGRVVEFGDRVALAADPDSRFARLLAAGMTEVLA